MIDSLKYQDYIAAIRYSSDDEVFFGRITGLNDLVIFEGTSVDELKEAFREAVEDYLDTCNTLNKFPEKTYKGVFNVRVSSALHKKAAAVASQYHITLNDLVNKALTYTVNHEKEIIINENTNSMH